MRLPLLVGRHGDASIAGIARMDRDEILLLRQPVVHVHEEVARCPESGRRIRREIGIADDDDAHLRFGAAPVSPACAAAGGGRRRSVRRIHRQRQRDGDRALLIARGFVQ